MGKNVKYKNKKECYTNEFCEFQIGDETLKKLQLVILEILKDLEEICEKYKLNYSLAGGSLLGAVRHEGFIPWDDDADVMMYSEDIEKLNTILSSDYAEKYYLASAKYGNSSCLFYKLMLKGTKIEDIESKNFPFDSCVNLDIFPIEDIHPNCVVRKIKSLKLKFYKTLLTSYYNIKYPSELLVEKTKSVPFLKKRFREMKIAYFMAKFIGEKRIVNKCYKIIECKKVSNLEGIPSAIGYNREVFARGFFKDTSYKNFENVKFRAIKNGSKYLANLYGDYMKIPPIEKRIKHVYLDVDLGIYN